MTTKTPRAHLALLALMASAAAAAVQAEPLKIGMITTLSTPAGYIGEDVRDAFMLAIGEDGKLGETPVEVIVEDDGLKPANAKQIADRMISEDIQLFTGVNFSNVLAAVQPSVMKADRFYVSTNPGPSVFAGKRCNPNYFVSSYQNDAFHEAAGLGANDLGYKRMVILAPNYQAGRDALTGFKRAFKGEIVDEIYTKLDQTDFSVEMARIRSQAPDAIYQFHPGGAGINFAKQYAASGLADTVPMVIPSFSMDARMVEATGDVAVGVYASALWTTEFDNEKSKAFVAEFEETYGRTPTMYAEMSYDAALLIESALDAVNGDISDADGFRAALKAADFTPLRDPYTFNTNNHPIQNYYLTKYVKTEDGDIVQEIVSQVAKDRPDAYVDECPMK